MYLISLLQREKWVRISKQYTILRYSIVILITHFFKNCEWINISIPSPGSRGVWGEFGLFHSICFDESWWKLFIVVKADISSRTDWIFVLIISFLKGWGIEIEINHLQENIYYQLLPHPQPLSWEERGKKHFSLVSSLKGWGI